MIAVNSSVLTLVVITGDRLFAIAFPMSMKQGLTSTKAAIIITITWVISVSLAMPQLFVRQQLQVQWLDRLEVWCEEAWTRYYINDQCETYERDKLIYYTIEGVVMYFVPIVFMIIAYSVIAYKIIKRKAPGTVIQSTVDAQGRSKKKVRTI